MMDFHKDLHPLYNKYYFLSKNFIKILLSASHQKGCHPQGHSLIIFFIEYWRLSEIKIPLPVYLDVLQVHWP